ncbi:nitrous oxide reductase accessory protein NosL [Pukyongiella litopenaei]|uniref:Copper resistance protein CopZ n=1 Tax=Pukyongiella litopenaei TaxID=2605946 RepID=A0A2S0MRY0_9RHOB|nr:nitrous oxide reductase accessory protein NosL [Pukyongiella litopenaei]AVO38616.1 copper resistance protein CopZ [Pukyongiella litopenaei]
MKRLLLCALLALTACREEVAEAPDPVPLTEDALSHFCQMNVAEHGGPKGQIHLKGLPVPIYFAQVRDLVAYLKSPERDAEITAIYVSDMGVAANWADPGAENWIDAGAAHFVIGAGVAGGMGAPEIVPFADEAAATAFIARYGGTSVRLDDIPDDAALAPVDLDTPLETPA